jgi:STE24 endopeptidase
MVRVGQFVVLTILLFSISAFAQTSAPSVPSAPAARSQTGPAFDVNAAVETYLAKIPSAQRARSNAYFEGGYWLLIWDFLTTVFVMWLLLHFRRSARMRDLAERITRFVRCKRHSTGLSSSS